MAACNYTMQMEAVTIGKDSDTIKVVKIRLRGAILSALFVVFYSDFIMFAGLIRAFMGSCGQILNER